MAEESQKRFQQAMDKLFRAPPKSTASGVQLSRGKKRPDMTSPFATVDPKLRGKAVQMRNTLGSSSSSNSLGEAPSCRPWDRDDLFRRISTFKSMTWFAKPQVVSAVNCARRGWINVDMDTIACEACRARMLFSTPPSWTQQQVDKAALVFSLKLDSGHIKLCPWIDNVCDEKLAHFPPTAAALLVDQYKTRHSVLSQLAALPMISPKIIDHLKSPLLEEFLRESLTVDRDESMETPQKEDIRNELTSGSPLTYYQAQKLIALCGWELRRLPYLVDSEDQLNQPCKDANISDNPYLSGKNQTITMHTSCNDGTSASQPDDDSQASEEAMIDPNSVVLECRLCGACIGLWNFSMVTRPMEFLRVTGYTQVNDDGQTLLSSTNRDETREIIGHNATSSNTTLDRRPANLSLTIAGGPSPAMHNYRAKIDLPIIGRNLRAWFIAESELKDDLVIKSSSGACKTPELLEGVNTEEGTLSSKSQVITEAQLENGEVAVQVSGNITEVADDAKSVDKVDPAVSDLGSSGKGTVTSHVGVNGESSIVVVEGTNPTQGGEQSNADEIIMAGVHPLIHNSSSSQGKELQNLSLDKAMEFDPFRLHRHFCPWIASNGGSSPGWEQTLSALERNDESSSPLSAPSSFIKVDDPVSSVQKLFTSPPSKRRKLVRPS